MRQWLEQAGETVAKTVSTAGSLIKEAAEETDYYLLADTVR